MFILTYWNFQKIHSGPTDGLKNSFTVWVTYLTLYCDAILSRWLKSEPSVPATVAPSRDAIAKNLV